MRRPMILLLCLTALLAEPALAGGDVRVTEGIVYGEGRVDQPEPGRARLLLDLYRPATTSKRSRPAVLLIHGGGFGGGSRRQPDLVRIAGGLARSGVVVVSIAYERLPAFARTALR